MAIAHRNGLRGDLAEELYQSTCVTLLQRLDLLCDHQSLAAWIATTAELAAVEAAPGSQGWWMGTGEGAKR